MTNRGKAYSDEYRQRVVDQYLADPEAGSIKLAKAHGISQPTVVKWVHRVAGREKMRRRGRPAFNVPSRRTREILEMLNYANKATVARYFGISREAVWAKAARWSRWLSAKKKKDQPAPLFQVGNEVEFDQERYQVIEVGLVSGTLRRKRDGMIFPRFFWVQAQHRCRLVYRQMPCKPLVSKA